MKQEQDAVLIQPATVNGGSLSRALPFLLLAALLAWLMGWYWTTAESIEATWSRNETYQHGYLIAPISAWLIWSRRRWLGQIAVAPVFWPIALLALLGFGWLLAELAQVTVARQYVLVLMLICAVPILLGARFAWALAFPLAFLAFAVPFGDFLIPPMMNFTADFTVGALRMTGIPVYREGMHFSLPTGTWSVVEACSGLRYLIAALTLGCLYAYLTYRRLKYRLIFIGLSVLVPIIANGLRAYMIVMLGHFSNMRLAVGVDHLIYGWIFFGVVIMLLFWLGSFWRENTEAPATFTELERPVANVPLAKLLTVTLVSAAVIAVWPAYSTHLQSKRNETPASLLVADVKGWQKVNEPGANWRPHYLAPRAHIQQAFEKDGRTVGLFIGYYYDQTENIKLVSSMNALTATDDKIWAVSNQRKIALSHEDQLLRANESLLRSQDADLLVWHWFWVKGNETGSAIDVKLRQAKSRLMGTGDDSAVIVLYTRVEERPEKADAALREFARDAFPAIEGSLSNAQRF